MKVPQVGASLAQQNVGPTLKARVSIGALTKTHLPIPSYPHISLLLRLFTEQKRNQCRRGKSIACARLGSADWANPARQKE